MSFDSIIGHEMPIRILRGMIKTGQTPHAFIFAGIEGIGKWKIALSFVKALNCLEMEVDFCDRCLSCQKINRMVHPDMFFIEPEKNVLKIEQVRALQQDIYFMSMEAKKKAVVINHAEKLNVHAANCLLKTLEEPPEDTVLILVAASTATMLPTILSRCQRICFAPLTDENITQFLRNRGVEKEKEDIVIHLSHGSIKRAIVLLESDFLVRRSEIADILSSLPVDSSDQVFQLSSIVDYNSSEFKLVLEFLQTWYRDMLFIKEGLSDSLLFNRDMTGNIREAAEHSTIDGIIRKIKRFQLMQDSTTLNLDLQQGLESILMQPH